MWSLGNKNITFCKQYIIHYFKFKCNITSVQNISRTRSLELCFQEFAESYFSTGSWESSSGLISPSDITLMFVRDTFWFQTHFLLYLLFDCFLHHSRHLDNLNIYSLNHFRRIKFTVADPDFLPRVGFG